MKKLINSVDSVIADTLKGVAAAHPQLRVDFTNRVIHRGEALRREKVALVSGGGSGHEPLHGGFVGTGMLDAAAVGEMFTSPTPDQILAATLDADAGRGVVHIVKNYSGDVMSYEMAAELATEQDVRVVSVLVADDVAVEDSTFTAGRRGTGLTVAMEKILGAAAEQGRSLDELEELAAKVNAGGRSMGMALTSCTVPAVGKPTFDLGEDQMEIGIGIHGEPGRHREPLVDAAHVARQVVEPILADLDYTGRSVLAIVNGMGATPLSELYIMFGEITELLGAADVNVVRTLVGDYVTSLDMAGFSLTLLAVDDELLQLWDAPVNTPGLRWGV